MWVMTKIGFFSVVAHRDVPDCLIVRARCEEDIVNINEEMGLGWWRDDEADYPYRMCCTPAELAAALARITADIDYDNFKSSIKDKKRKNAYVHVWQAMRLIDDRNRLADMLWE